MIGLRAGVFKLTPQRPTLLEGTVAFHFELGDGCVRPGTGIKVLVETIGGGGGGGGGGGDQVRPISNLRLGERVGGGRMHGALRTIDPCIPTMPGGWGMERGRPWVWCIRLAYLFRACGGGGLCVNSDVVFNNRISPWDMRVIRSIGNVKTNRAWSAHPKQCRTERGDGRQCLCRTNVSSPLQLTVGDFAHGSWRVVLALVGLRLFYLAVDLALLLSADFAFRNFCIVFGIITDCSLVYLAF